MEELDRKILEHYLIDIEAWLEHAVKKHDKGDGTFKQIFASKKEALAYKLERCRERIKRECCLEDCDLEAFFKKDGYMNRVQNDEAIRLEQEEVFKKSREEFENKIKNKISILRNLGMKDEVISVLVDGSENFFDTM